MLPLCSRTREEASSVNAKPCSALALCGRPPAETSSFTLRPPPTFPSFTHLMNSSTTTTNNEAITTQHGKPRNAQVADNMDIDTTKSSSFESAARPDVMETPVDSTQSTNHTQTHGDITEAGTSILSQEASAAPQSSSLQDGKPEVEGPLLLGQKGKASSRVSSQLVGVLC